ncbi:MAG TPA: 3-phosphoshikimate 1-carboxyvinyltransferase [Chroococcales cyanobacterium]
MTGKTLNSLKGRLKVPGDKSISHRALMFSALTRGTSKISGLSPAEDCQSTARCLRTLGLKITADPGADGDSAGRYIVESPGLAALVAPDTVLDAGNSGTTMRIMSGLVAGRPFKSRLDGDASLRRRPMSRVLDLLEQMGAEVIYEEVAGERPAKKGLAPFAIKGARLTGKRFSLPVASAQVETALMLAGLQADGETVISVPSVLRDHTQRMFRFIGVPFDDLSAELGEGSVRVKRLAEPLPPYVAAVPADISSAAFFMVGAACLPGSELVLTDLGMNVGRRLVLDVLLRMGADIQLLNEREEAGEPIADLRVKYSGRLRGTVISGEEIAAGIDEIPILALAGALCQGELTVRGAEELRHKESDRLAAITRNLRAAGATLSDTTDGFTIEGQATLPGNSQWETFEDHRLAMTGLVASVVARQPLKLTEVDSVKISYPGFQADLSRLIDN